jgi:nucleoside-diphosphate-sugar epimerase
MSLHVIVGAGSIGSATAQLLADRGEQVRIVSRRGTGPDHESIRRIAADATSAAALRDLAAGAIALYNCANPPYHRWATDWPPLAAALLTAAEATGAVLVTTGNLYGYGPVAGPMTEALPLQPTTVKGRVRAAMWHDALAAHRAGRVRVTEARASDFVGAGAKTMLNEVVLPKVLTGKRALVPADLDAPHSWTYLGDVARMLVALAGDERAWGAAWHVPSPPPASIREMAVRAAVLAGAPAPRLATASASMLWLAGLFSIDIRAFREMRYQFQRPFVLDSTAAQTTFGITPTPLDRALREMVGATRDLPAAVAAP